MLRRRLALSAIVIVSMSACRFEDRSPDGTRLDEEEIRAVVTAYYDGLTNRAWAGARTLFWDSATVQVRQTPVSTWRSFSDPDAYGAFLAARPGMDREIRALRIDTRQEGDFASAWVETRRVAGGARLRDTPPDHFLLRRIDGAWRIAGLVAVIPPAGLQ